jgi:hypothetical protein
VISRVQVLAITEPPGPNVSGLPLYQLGRKPDPGVLLERDLRHHVGAAAAPAARTGG